MKVKYLVTPICVFAALVVLTVSTGQTIEPIPFTQKTVLDQAIIDKLTPLEKQLIQKLIEVEEADTREYPDTIENQILTRFLSSSDFNGYFTFVYSETTTIGLSWDEPEFWREQIKYYLEDFGKRITNLVDTLFEINATPKMLSIKSCLPEGYYIGYDNAFWNCMKEVCKDVYKRGSGWVDFSLKNFPHFVSNLSVSLPVYDPETGFVLLYTYSSGTNHAYPFIFLMKYEDGELIDIFHRDLTSIQIAYDYSYEPDFDD